MVNILKGRTIQKGKNLNTKPSENGLLANRPDAGYAGAGATYFATDVGGGTLYVSNGTNWNLSTTQSPYYFFHGIASQQILGDPKFYDISGALNDGVFGANLSNANAWANSGYVSTVAPTGGSTDSVIRMPNLDYDYNGGQGLIIWWLGLGTAGASDVEWMGDGNSSTYHGLAIRCKATSGLMQPFMRDGAGSYFFGTTTDAVMNGSLNSYALAIDGTNKKMSQWVNESVEGTGFTTFNNGNPADPTNSNTFNIGSAVPAVGTSTDGMAVQTRALVILRLPPTVAMPSATILTNLFKQLRRSPSKLITNGAF